MGAQGFGDDPGNDKSGDGKPEGDRPVAARTSSPSWDGNAEANCPGEMIDPISEEIMLDPVMLLETGQTYERASILRWFEACQASGQGCRDPLTGTVLTSLELVPNFALKRLINSWAESHSIRDIPQFSKEHSQGLKRLASQMGRAQLSPPKPSHNPSAREGAPAAEPNAAASGAAPAAANAAAPAARPTAAGPRPEAAASAAGGERTLQDPPGVVGGEVLLRPQPAGSGHPLQPMQSQPHPNAAGGSEGEGTAGIAAGAGQGLGQGGPQGQDPADQDHASYPSVFGARPQSRPAPVAAGAALPPANGGAGAQPGPPTSGGAPAAAVSPLPLPQPPLAVAPSYQQHAAAAGTGSMLYPAPGRRTLQDKLKDTEASLQALQPSLLASEAGKGAAAYHAWTLMQLASGKECKEVMLRSQAIPLAVYLLGLPGLEEAKPSLAGLLQRLSVTGPAVANDILTAGGVHALAMLVGSEDRRKRVAASNALYFMGWLGEQIRWTAAATLAQQAVQQRMPPNPIYALWRFWGTLPPAPVPRPQPPLTEGWELLLPSADAALPAPPAPPAPLPPPTPTSVPAPQVAAEDREEWEALTFLLHMLSSPAQQAGQQQQQQLASLDARGTGLPQVLAHSATSAGSSEAVQYAAITALRALCRAVPSSRAELLAPLVLTLGGANWDAAARAALVLWELLYEEGAGNSFLVLQALHSIPQFVPSLLAVLSDAPHHPALGKAAIGLLGCCVFDGAASASSSSSAAAVDSQRYQIADSWRQALLAPGSPTMASLLQAAQDAPQDAHLSQLALTALANLAAARGTAAAAGPAAPQPKPSKLDRWSAKLQDKLQGKPLVGALGSGGSHAGGSHEPKPVAPGPRGAILSHETAVPTLLQLVMSPGGGFGGLEGGWGSGSYAASLSPPGTPSSATSRGSAANFGFTPVGQVGRFGSGDAQGLGPLLLPPALLALMNLASEAGGREQIRAWARGSHVRQQQLQAALNAAMANRQLGQQAQELARRLLHELSATPGPLQARLACLPVAPPPRAAAYPTP